MSQRMFVVVGAAAVLMFGFAPLMIAWAPYESTMGLVQKVFYFHVPAWFVMFLAIFVSGIASAVHLLKDRPAADRLVRTTCRSTGSAFAGRSAAANPRTRNRSDGGCQPNRLSGFDQGDGRWRRLRAHD